MDNKLVRVDGVKWRIVYVNSNVQPRRPIAVCPDHHLDLIASASRTAPDVMGDYKFLHCDEGHVYKMPRLLGDERKYVLRKIDSIALRKLDTIDLDGELTPIAKEKVQSSDGKYFLAAQIMESKRGIQVVVYAGEKGRKNKTQIFVEPEIKRLAFDQKDLNPTEVFAKVKATFSDGSSQEIKK